MTNDTKAESCSAYAAVLHWEELKSQDYMPDDTNHDSLNGQQNCKIKLGWCSWERKLEQRRILHHRKERTMLFIGSIQRSQRFFGVPLPLSSGIHNASLC